MKRSLLALVLAAVVAPSAQAMHAPAEVSTGTSGTFGTDAAARHHHPDVLQPATRIVTVTGSDSFDWGDAGIGAAGTLGVILLVGGSAILFTRDSRRKGPARSTRPFAWRKAESPTAEAVARGPSPVSGWLETRQKLRT
jgi:hypothetical protein